MAVYLAADVLLGDIMLYFLLGEAGVVGSRCLEEPEPEELGQGEGCGKEEKDRGEKDTRGLDDDPDLLIGKEPVPWLLVHWFEPHNEDVPLTTELPVHRPLVGGEVIRPGPARDIDIVLKVQGQTETPFHGTAANEGGIEEGATVTAEFRDVGVPRQQAGPVQVHPPVVASLCGWEVQGFGLSRDIGAILAVELDVLGVIDAAPAQEGGIDKGTPVGVQFCDKDVIGHSSPATVGIVVAAWGGGKIGSEIPVRQGGEARDIGAPLAVNGDALPHFVVPGPEEGGIDKGRAVPVHLCHEDVGLPVVGTIETPVRGGEVL